MAQQPRDDLFIEHAVQLARHARREEEARLADVEREAACRADGIVDQLGAGGQHGLLAIAGRHHSAAPTEQLVHAAEPFLAEDQLDAGGLGGHLLGQIVDSGAEPAVDDDGVDPLPGEPEGLEQGLAIVADRRPPQDWESDVAELLADVAEVGVDDRAGQHLVARADDLDAHGAGA